MKTTAFLLALTFWSGAAIAAPVDKYNITPEEHAACDSDAMSLCASAYPNEDSLLACMKINRQSLSAVCQTAFVLGMKKRHIPL